MIMGTFFHYIQKHKRIVLGSQKNSRQLKKFSAVKIILGSKKSSRLLVKIILGGKKNSRQLVKIIHGTKNNLRQLKKVLVYVALMGHRNSMWAS